MGKHNRIIYNPSRRSNKYLNSVVYKISCKDETINEVYIGSTTNFMKRKNAHKYSCNNKNSESYNNPIYNLIRTNGGFKNWDIKIVSKINCSNKRSLEKHEQNILNQHENIMNLQNAVGNKTKYHKIYRDANRNKINTDSKKYYIKNINRFKKSILCVCGVMVRIYNIKRHNTSIRHKTEILRLES